MEAFSQQRHKLCSFLKSVDASHFALGESDDFPILPHLVQRLHKLMSDDGGSYLDKLVLHSLVRDTIKLDDASFQKCIDDVRDKADGKGSHAKTINKALRRIIATDKVDGISDKVRNLSWKTREGLKHEWPTICDYCDFLAAIAETIRVSYRSVYSAFGDSFGHYNVLQGKLPVSGTTFIGEMQPRYDLRNVGIKWTDIKGEVSPQGSKPAKQIRKVVAVAEIQQKLDQVRADTPTPSVDVANIPLPPGEPESSVVAFASTSFQPIEPAGSPRPYNPVSPTPIWPPAPLTKSSAPKKKSVIQVLHSPPAQTPLRTKMGRAKRRLIYDAIPDVDGPEPPEIVDTSVTNEDWTQSLIVDSIPDV
jgi:hypothetical protein